MFRFLNLVLGLIIILLQVRLWFGENSLPETRQLARQIAKQQIETDKLGERNAELFAEVKDLRSGLDTIEERARYELGMVRESETFFLLKGSTGTTVMTEASLPSVSLPAKTLSNDTPSSEANNE